MNHKPVPLPTLYHRTKGGAIEQWTVHTEGPEIITTYGVLGGQTQESRKVATAKNVGKTNETTPDQQATLEAAALWRHKRDRKYRESPTATDEPLPLPMLAHDWRRYADKVVYPCAIQPKLNGLRCMTRGNESVELLSRNAKPWHLPHIIKALHEILPRGYELDGELYRHGRTLQDIVSLARDVRPESEQLEYWVFDIPMIDGVRGTVPWGTRNRRLKELASWWPTSSPIRLVATYNAYNREDVLRQQQEFIREGFEGAVVRNMTGLYRYGYRSYDLLKVKTFQDAEFLVVGVKEGVGKMAGCAIWCCRTQAGREFDVTVATSMEERARQWRERNQYIGRFLTVRFFDLTPDGKPFLPVGVAFRIPEDLPDATKA